TVNITISQVATTGARDFTVTNTDGQASTCTGCFTVTAPVGVTFTTPTALTGTIIATFSRDVTGVTGGSTGNFIFNVTGSGAVLAAGLTCRDAVDASTNCAGSAVRKAILTPTAPLVPGQNYTATVNPASASTSITDSNGAPINQTSGAFRGSLVEQESSVAASYTWRTVPTTRAWGGSYTTERI